MSRSPTNDLDDKQRIKLRDCLSPNEATKNFWRNKRYRRQYLANKAIRKKNVTLPYVAFLEENDDPQKR
jgi:hypothetical protein